MNKGRESKLKGSYVLSKEHFVFKAYDFVMDGVVVVKASEISARIFTRDDEINDSEAGRNELGW
jgi:hypothetical protein